MNNNQRTFRHFDDELDKLRTRLIKMGSMALEQTELAFRASMEGDIRLVQKVIEWDTKVDKYDVKIERLCMRLLALQQPVARDLRSVMTALALNTTLERIGDLAVNIAERIEPLLQHREMVMESPLPKIEEVVSRMLRKSFDSFIHNDIEMARSVYDLDRAVDALDGEMFYYCTGIMKLNASLVEPASHLMLLSRHAERLGDHATSIAGTVVFLVEAKIVKHKNWGNPVDVHDIEDETGPDGETNPE